MDGQSKHAGNVVLLRGACLWLLLTLVLAWCLVLMKLEVAFINALFQDFNRLLQAHIDFLLMTALLFGFYAARVPLPWHVRWSMVIGAFTNSSVFIVQSMIPATETGAQGLGMMLFTLYTGLSITITTYGFGAGAVVVFRSTFD